MMEEDPGWQYLRLTPEEMLKVQSKPFDAKKNCWVPDAEDGFVDAEITSTKGDDVTVMTSNHNEVSLKKDNVMEMNPPKFELAEDMSNLTYLNEATVLHNLRARYFRMLIYTYSGLFCVVINPYKRLPIYTESVYKMFMGRRRNEMPPHLVAVSDEAYRNMLQDRENQSMLITGESGAGKTENTKKVISYFAVVGASQKEAGAGGGDGGPSLEDQIVQTNPVLEAFGNAKTVRNNNSSRFGKFIRIHFGGTGILAGGDIEHYLLEKSRVIRQAPGERCYHIFYQIMSGFDPKMRDFLKLTEEVKYYHFVSQAELTIDGMDDKEEMELTDTAFNIMGFTEEEKHNLFRLCSAIMHMGEMKFKQRPREEQAEADGTHDCENAAEMYQVSAEAFMTALLKPKVRVGTEWVAKGQNMEQVNWSVGALAKGIYSKMFAWLIDRCNHTLSVGQGECKHFIGVLDIAGFEIFDFNSFEQLWINFVNEKLQQFFNHHMFVLEQEEYKREGIQWTFIDFGLDLLACIELIEKPLGIISILDEECIVPKATDLTFGQKVNDTHLGKHPNLTKPKPPKGKQAEAHFAVAHYAGTVRYNVTNWLEKNKDPLNDSAVAILKASENKLLQAVWKSYTTQEEAAAIAKAGGGGGKKKGKSGAFATVSMLYRESLTKLMDMLHTTHPHFIRCIIPNEKKTSGMIDAALCLNQLTCNGVLEGIRICRKGFPNRMLYPDFKHRYAILAASECQSDSDAKKSSCAMMTRIVTEGYITEEEHRIGETKIFFKAGVLGKLEECRDDVLARLLTGLQSQIRWQLAQREYERRKSQLAGITIVQRNVRSWCTLRTWAWFKLFGQVKPLLNMGKEAEEAAAAAERLKDIEGEYEKEKKLRMEMEEANAKLLTEKNDLFTQLEAQKGTGSELTDRLAKLETQKHDLERQVQDLSEKCDDQEERQGDLQKAKKKVEQEVENCKKAIQDHELAGRKLESEKQSRDQQIKSLQDEMAQQDEVIAKLNKEKKHQEEVNRKLMDDLQGEEDKVNHLNKVKSKLEQTLDDLEDSLERERRSRQDVEKGKRKVEQDLKVSQENADELSKQKHDVENNLKKKEAEMHTMATKLDDEQSQIQRLQRQIKDQQSKISDLEDELDTERSHRSKTESSKASLQRELDELSERLDEAGGATAAQVEMNKRREAETSKIKRDLEEANTNHEAALAALRKKHNDAVAELGDQMDNLNKSKSKLEKEKAALARDVEEMTTTLDHEAKQRIDAERQAKQHELMAADLQGKVDEQQRQLAEFTSLKGRMHGENSDLSRQIEDLESQVASLQRIKSTLTSQLEEAKHSADDESKEKHSIQAQLRNVEHELDSLRDAVDVESEGKAELQRQVAKAHSDIQQWKARFETEGITRIDEIEEAKRKLNQRVTELTEQLEQANVKLVSTEKSRHKLMGELDDAQVDVERANSYANSLEKKQKEFDHVINDWKRKNDDLHMEMDNTQRENRNLSTECFKLKTTVDEMGENIEALRRENKNLAQEIKDMTDQLGEGGRSVHELQKMVRRLELEKEEMQGALDEAESSLEAEESKVLRAQVEIAQVRQEIEKRIQEKEEEFDNTRKNHQRALDSMQATLETEAKGRAEALRMKKKLESDINELEIALDHANKANADAQKNIKRYLDQIRELQVQVEDEQRMRENVNDQYHTSEQRCQILQSEKEDMMHAAEQADRSRRQAEQAAHEAQTSLNDLQGQVASLSSVKRKLEGELAAMHSELDDALNELKKADHAAKNASADALRLSEELRHEHDHSQTLDRARKSLETQIKDMQLRVDEAEAAALKGGKKVITKLEARVRELEQELDSEQRRLQDADKNLRKHDRRIKELEYQYEEQKRGEERIQEVVDKLQAKLKVYKRQIEEAEEVAASNLAKYRQVSQQLDDAEERADQAENSVARLRAKHRSSASAGGVKTSQSAAVVRH